MREGWNYVSLGQCCDVLNGLWKGKKEPFVHVGVIRNANFTKEFTLDFSNVEYLDVEERQYTKRKLRKGDLIVEKSGGSEKWPVGRAVLFLKEGGEFSFSNFTSVLRIKDSVNISPKYLYIYLFYVYMRGDTRNMQKATTGIHNIEFEKYLSIQIPLPPLSEQQRIVDYLDKTFAEIDALKAKAAEAVANAKAMFDAALREEMAPNKEAPMKQIGEIFKSYSGGTPIKSNKEYYENGNIPWLRSGEVCQKYINETELFITEAGLKNSSAKYYPINTVVIAMYGATAAQVGILKIEATSNQAICGLLPNDSYLPEYVYYWFSVIQKDLAAQAQGGAQPNISQEKIKKVLIPIINLNDQQRIVARLDSLRSLLTELEQKYAKIAAECDALKQAILKETFE